MNKTKWKNEKGQEVKFIKIIDLLIKIANGETDIPKIIRTNNGFETWIYDKEYKRYYLKQADYITLTFEVTDKLNDTVEIIEEEPEIDIQEIEKIRDYRTSEDDLYNDNFEDFRQVINDLVDAVKQLDKRINNK